VQRLVAFGAALLLAGGCGGSDEKAVEEEQPPPPLPACAERGKALERPKGLPRGFPLPPGTVLQRREQSFAGQAIFVGAVPGDLDGAAEHFDSELPVAGYSVGRGDAETNEREKLFTGKSVRGGWRLNTIPNCAGAVGLTLVIIRQT